MASSGQFKAPEMPVPVEDEAVSRYWVRFGRRELPLEGGETLIGRSDDCQVVVSEALVSRRHARIVMDGGRPYVEDLGSANGTFVNQARLHGRTLLFAGDLIFIGTCEIEIVRRADEDRLTSPGLEPYESDSDTPSGVSVFESARSDRTPSSRTRKSVSRIETERPEEDTSEAQALEYAGRLADKMFTMGRVDAAQTILEPPLEELLASARLGRIPAPPLLDAAGRCAVKLANETLSGRWVDIAVELHFLACRPLREETIQQLASLRAKAPIGSDALLLRYHERLRGHLASMAPQDRILCERVACLVPGLEE
jgi:pSer/pThr/pTyr-binding forkhead associated (FHA) protein